MQTLKSTLRKQALAKLSLSAPFDSTAINEQFLKAFAPCPTHSLAFFWPLKNEPDMRVAATAYHENGAICALPVLRTDGEHGLFFRRWQPDSVMQKTALKFMEPQEGAFITPNIVLVPLLLADIYGGRLGRGAGFYDATLAALQGAKIIGVAFDEQIYEGELPMEAHDMRLDMLITPKQIYSFQK